MVYITLYMTAWQIPFGLLSPSLLCYYALDHGLTRADHCLTTLIGLDWTAEQDTFKWSMLCHLTNS